MRSNQPPALRLQAGQPDSYRRAFSRLASVDHDTAASILRESRFTFPQLFVLLPVLEEHRLYQELGGRSLTACRFIARVLVDEHLQELASVSGDCDDLRETLRWIVRSGAPFDGLSASYDHVLDAAAAYLIDSFRDDSILLITAELLFRRHRAGRFTHDLSWAFFRTGNRDALALLARYLRGSGRDAAFAKELLQPPHGSGHIYMAWFHENRSFLEFTDESCQYTSNPVPCRVNQLAKYLQVPIEARGGHLDVTGKEELQRSFRLLSPLEQETLARYSHQLHRKNPRAWERWLLLPPERQLLAAGKRRRTQ